MTKAVLTTHKFVLFILVIAIIFQGCSASYFRGNYKEASELLRASESAPEKLYLKAHLNNGQAYILRDTWEVDTTRRVLTGNGFKYDINRKLIDSGPTSIPLDSIAILETNQDLEQIRKDDITYLSVLGTIDATLGIICIISPKTCFGSCPTFYINGEDNPHHAHAEGFSNAVTPSTEYTDIDALGYSTSGIDTFSVMMKNEAWETHNIKQVRLLAAAKGKDEEVYHSPDDTFYRCDRKLIPGKATAEEGDITNLLLEADKTERFSLADENNMRSKEEILLTFDPDTDLKHPGLLMSFRQSLMSTYLFYTAMDYMGSYYTEIIAEMETTGTSENLLYNTILAELGGIEVHVWNSNEKSWELQGSFSETGPIAFNHQLLPLQQYDTDENLKVKIILNKGYWRIDHIALTNIREEVEPLILQPEVVLNKGVKDHRAEKILNDDENHLVALPGSAYQLKFVLPSADDEYSVFIQSRGYYMEWLRKNWLEDNRLLKLRQMVKNPRRYLRKEAGSYKEYEKKMEELFWNSRIDTKSFTSNEN